MIRIREKRRAMGMTMKELGRLVGVSEGAISHYETGRREPDPEMLKRIADVLGVTTDYLIGRDSPSSATLVPDTSGSMPATPDMRIAVTGPDGMTQTLLHETAHYTGSKPAQATQQEKIAVLERDLYEMLNPHRASRIAEAAEILQSMTDEEYKMALNVLRAMKK